MRTLCYIATGCVLALCASGCATRHASEDTLPGPRPAVSERCDAPLPPHDYNQWENICRRPTGVSLGVAFEVNSTVLLSEGKKLLELLVPELQRWPEDRVKVLGYTCDLGDRHYNQILSLRRAERVRDYLSSQGIALERMKVSGMGEFPDAFPEHSDVPRRWMRIVNVEVVPKIE